MVRVRKLAEQRVRDVPLLLKVVAPFRDALREGARLDSSLSQTLPGAMLSRKLMPGAYLVMLLPALFLALPFLFLLFATHVRLTRQFGPTVATGVEVAAGLAVVARIVLSLRAARRPEAEPVNEELTLAPVEVEERLAAGTLRPFDLVHDGQVWTTLEQSPAFELACEVPVARARTRRRLGLAAKLLGGVAVVGAWGWWLFAA